jgi:hypothetical protein
MLMQIFISHFTQLSILNSFAQAPMHARSRRGRSVAGGGVKNQKSGAIAHVSSLKPKYSTVKF